jgi:hypothetical protein
MADALADLAKPPAAGGRVSAGEDSLGDRIVELLMGTRMKAPTIAEMLGVNPASVRDRLSKDPRFDREPTGFWVVVQDHLPLDAARAEEES